MLDELAGLAPTQELRERRLRRVAEAIAAPIAEAIVLAQSTVAPPDTLQSRFKLDDSRLRAIPRIIPIPSPAAGADWSQQVPDGVMWRVVGCTAQLVTSATVSNREPMLHYGDGTTFPLRVSGGSAQTATQTVEYHWSIGASGFNGLPGTGKVQAALPNMQISGAWVVRVVTSGLVAGDQWSAVSMYVVEIEDTAGPLVYPGILGLS